MIRNTNPGAPGLDSNPARPYNPATAARAGFERVAGSSRRPFPVPMSARTATP